MNEKDIAQDDVSVQEAASSATAAGEAAAGGAQGGHAELAALLEDARGKADEHWDMCLRLQADLDNLRKRSERDLSHAHKFALERFAGELLPVRDSMEMGLAAFDAEGSDVSKLREGVELTLQMLTGVLGKFQIEEVDPQDQPFNPDFHQAMSIQERADVAPNTVVTVVQKGYTLNGRLLRPAMVVVAKAPAAA
jgi:molecular chaperone GrpE